MHVISTLISVPLFQNSRWWLHLEPITCIFHDCHEVVHFRIISIDFQVPLPYSRFIHEDFEPCLNCAFGGLSSVGLTVKSEHLVIS